VVRQCVPDNRIVHPVSDPSSVNALYNTEDLTNFPTPMSASSGQKHQEEYLRTVYTPNARKEEPEHLIE